MVNPANLKRVDPADAKFTAELQDLVRKHLGKVSSPVMMSMLAQASGRMAAIAVSSGALEEDAVTSVRNMNFAYGLRDQKARNSTFLTQNQRPH